MRSLVLAWIALAGCDNDVAVRKPDFSIGRMLEQPRADAYEPSHVFADGKVMREPPKGTIPHDVERDVPPAVTRALLEKGRVRFDVFCAPCHGVLGDGVSVVASKMELRKPPSLVDGRYASLDVRTIVTTAEQGFGLMPSYADALSVHDLWAVAHYVRALQLAHAVKAAELAPEVRAELDEVAP